MLIKCFISFFKYYKSSKKAFINYSLLSLAVGVLELFGIALIYPFVMKILEAESSGHFYSTPFAIGLAIVFLYTLKNIFMIYYSYIQADYTRKIEAEVNLRYMQCFLAADYTASSKIPYARKTNILHNLIPNFINNFVLRLSNLNINICIFVLISGFLLIKFPCATIITALFSVMILLIQNIYFKPKLRKISENFVSISENFNRSASEILLNIKGVKIANEEFFFFNNYKNAIKKFFRINRNLLFLNTVPPFITEPFIIFMLFALLGIISLENKSSPEVLIATYAVVISAMFRLAPVISRIQTNLNGINSVLPIVSELMKTYDEFGMNNIKEIKKTDFHNFNNSIELKNISFGYDKNKPVLKNINLDINKGEFVGISGLSGAGKTTLADILAGLLPPDEGTILVDGKDYKEVFPLRTGYIPQEVNFRNSSIRENIAPAGEAIDDSLVFECLKRAQLYDFVTNNYPEGIYANPFIDSAGMSQGQKQRMAIARALYLKPDILILDEATSALDTKTEQEICNTLELLKGTLTIISVTHRLSTLKFADKIVFIKDSSVNEIANFDKLCEINSDFNELVKNFSKQ